MKELHHNNEIYMYVMSSISHGLPIRCLLLVSKEVCASRDYFGPL